MVPYATNFFWGGEGNAASVHHCFVSPSLTMLRERRCYEGGVHADYKVGDAARADVGQVD